MYKITCSSTIAKLQVAQILKDILIEKNWKYYTYEMISNAPTPIIITFTLLSGNTYTYIINSIIDIDLNKIINDNFNVDNLR